MAMGRFKGINHLAMATADMDRTISYWRDLLGMRLVAGLGSPGYKLYFFEISDIDLLAFFEWPQVEPVPEKDHGYPTRGPFVFDHVSIGVVSEEDLWVLKDKLEAADFWVSEVMDHGFIHSIYTFDPNGIPLEFSCEVPGVDIRKKPRMMDKDPSATTRQGPEPRPEKWPSVENPTPKEDRRSYPGEGTELIHGRGRAW